MADSWYDIQWALKNQQLAGIASQYYRGDKTWQTLDKTAVGLANVDNTSDVSKPISAAAQTALDGKANKTVIVPVAPTMLNGWVNYGSGMATLGYWKDDLGYVYIKGAIKSGTPDNPIFTLPTDYRPLANLCFAADDNAIHSYIWIDYASGYVIGHTNVRLSLNIKFMAGV